MSTSLMQLRSQDLEENIGYYAHIVALLTLYFLWRLPTVTPRTKSAEGTKYRPRIIGASPRQKSLSKSSLQREQKIQEAEEILKELHPNSTAAERRRFLLARKCNRSAAAKQLGGYLEWRKRHTAIESEHFRASDCDTSIEADENDWNRAVAVARNSCSDSLSTNAIPRLARMYHDDDRAPICDKDGFRIIHILPGQMDPGLAKPSTYALALALYLDRKLDRSSTQLYTVMLDVRGGKTWPNIHPCKQLPFMKNLTKLLLAMFPERLYQCLLYPLPPAFLWIWNLARGFIDPMTASKVRLLNGPARSTSPPPVEALQESVAKHTVEFLEEEREATFVFDK